MTQPESLPVGAEVVEGAVAVVVGAVEVVVAAVEVVKTDCFGVGVAAGGAVVWLRVVGVTVVVGAATVRLGFVCDDCVEAVVGVEEPQGGRQRRDTKRGMPCPLYRQWGSQRPKSLRAPSVVEGGRRWRCQILRIHSPADFCEQLCVCSLTVCVCVSSFVCDCSAFFSPS